jgi:mRNA-degrading endonuclease RelE of RelBE toxin-antitoxin system
MRPSGKAWKISPTGGRDLRVRFSTSCASAMAYRVELTLRAERDLGYLSDRISVGESIDATRWFKGLERAIYTLERFPRRCSLAPERRKAKRRLRHLLYGAKPDVYRVIFEIDEPRKVVRVVTIRYGAMDEFIAGL